MIMIMYNLNYSSEKLILLLKSKITGKKSLLTLNWECLLESILNGLSPVCNKTFTTYSLNVRNIQSYVISNAQNLIFTNCLLFLLF